MPFTEKKKEEKPVSEADKGPTPYQSSSHNSAAHDESNWLISYADMMTLLCAFFIMLFSMAKLDEPKYDSFKQALSKQFGGQYVSSNQDLADHAEQLIQELGLESSTSVRSDPSGVSIAFESTVFFGVLSAEVSSQGTKILSQVIEKLKEQQSRTGKTYKIVVEGHTDNRPVISGKYPSNWELSAARASGVIRMFIAHGFAPKNLTAIGYADTHPQTPISTGKNGMSESDHAKNRRVILRILEPKIDAIPFPDSAKAPAPNVTQTAGTAKSPATPSSVAPAPFGPPAPSGSSGFLGVPSAEANGTSIR